MISRSGIFPSNYVTKDTILSANEPISTIPEAAEPAPETQAEAPPPTVTEAPVTEAPQEVAPSSPPAQVIYTRVSNRRLRRQRELDYPEYLKPRQRSSYAHKLKLNSVIPDLFYSRSSSDGGRQLTYLQIFNKIIKNNKFHITCQCHRHKATRSVSSIKVGEEERRMDSFIKFHDNTESRARYGILHIVM